MLGTLRAAVDTVIPPDAFEAGWEGGVGSYLDTPECAWAGPSLATLVALLDERVRGTTFAGLDPVGRETVLRDVEEGVEGRRLVDVLRRVCFEGYYAQTHTRRPEGLRMTGFDDLPQGVRVVEPDPLPTITAAQVRADYDAIVIGSGPGGGSVARVLSEAGRRVLVVERATAQSTEELRGDHLHGKRNALYAPSVGPGAGHPRVLDTGADEQIVDGLGDAAPYGLNAMALGGGTRVWQGMAWRFLPEDFAMASTYGVPEGSTLADWPLDYADLEPFYTRAEHELGVSGETGGLTLRTPRSAGYPMPALPGEPARTVLSLAATRLGWNSGPPPLALNSVPHRGRAACVMCSQCVGHACPVDAKNGSQNTVLADAVASGWCDVLLDAQAVGIRDDGGRASVRLMADTRTRPVELHLTSDVVIVAAGAVETARLLLMSGLGNDQVGRNLHDHTVVMVTSVADEPVKTFRGPGHSIATLDQVHSPGSPWGGGVLFDLNQMLPLTGAGMAEEVAGLRWGPAHKSWMRDERARLFGVFGIGQEIPHAASRVSLSTAALDRWGMPVARLRKDRHWASGQVEDSMAERATEWLEAAGARHVTRLRNRTGVVSAAGEHSVGTARMGADPATSATDPFGRLHGSRSVYVADGSLHPSNGSVNPTLTLMANAFRVAEHLVDHWPQKAAV